MSAVALLDDSKVYLNVSADDVTSSGWQDPPVGYESGGQDPRAYRRNWPFAGQRA